MGDANMMWHCRHSFNEVAQTTSKSRSKVRLVPLNTPRHTKIDPQVLFAKEKRCALRFPPHSTKPFLDCAGKAKRRQRFSRTRSSEKEKHGAFV